MFIETHTTGQQLIKLSSDNSDITIIFTFSGFLHVDCRSYFLSRREIRVNSHEENGEMTNPNKYFKIFRKKLVLHKDT